MKKYAVVGAGKMGWVIAKSILEGDDNCQVMMFDIHEKTLQEAVESVGSERMKVSILDIYDINTAVQMLSEQDVMISALPHSESLPCIKAAIAAKVPCIDLAGEAPEERLALDEQVKNAGITIIPGLGVAPGLSNICVARGVELLDKTTDAIIYVGGIPVEKTPPMDYQTVYSLDSVFKTYLRPAKIYQSGVETEVAPLSGLEILNFPGPIGNLEAYYTDGLASLTLTMKGKISGSLEEKTLRYPGFAEKVKFLLDSGFLETSPVKVGEQEVVPLDFLIKLLKPKLQLGSKGDLLVMRIIVNGYKDNQPHVHQFELIDEYDQNTNYSAMARTTGFPAVCAARMLTNQKITSKGVLFPEQIFIGTLYSDLISNLSELGILIKLDDY